MPVALIRADIRSVGLGQRRGVGRALAGDALALRLAPRTPPGRARVVGEHTEEPRQGRALAVVLVAMLEHRQEGLLHQVLGRGLARGEVPREAQELGRRPIEQPRERARIAARSVARERVVGGEDEHRGMSTRAAPSVARSRKKRQRLGRAPYGWSREGGGLVSAFTQTIGP